MVLKQQFKIPKMFFLMLYKHSVVTILFPLLTQAVAVLSCNAGQVFPAVQCYENGPFSPWTSLSYWATQCKWTGIGRICHLQRGTGKLFFGLDFQRFFLLVLFCFLFFLRQCSMLSFVGVSVVLFSPYIPCARNSFCLKL